MKNTKKSICTLTAASMLLGCMTGCGGPPASSSTPSGEAVSETSGAVSQNATTEGAGVGSDTTITLLNTKSEVQDYLEELATAFKADTGITLECYTNTEENHIAEKYAAGEPYTIMMMDHPDVSDYQEYLLDLSGSDWAATGGNVYGLKINDALYGFPFCVEAVGMVYNAQAIEDITGEPFDRKQYTTNEAFQVLLQKLVDGGMETPIAVNKDDWSLASHLFGQLYCLRGDGSESDSLSFVDQLKAGSIDLAADADFNAMMDTIDTLLKYNINAADPLSASYDLNAEYLAEGSVAFWPNGSWASGIYDTTDKIGIMPMPINTENPTLSQKLIAGASKMLVVDASASTLEQQQAAKTFLSWLVSSAAGQKFMVDQSGMIVAFDNVPMTESAPLSISAYSFVRDNATTYWYQEMPSDHNAEVGALAQKYISGGMDRAAFAAALQSYWAK